MKFIDGFLSLFDLEKLQGAGERYNDDENEEDVVGALKEMYGGDADGGQ